LSSVEGTRQPISDGLQQVRHSDGTVSMDLQGRFQNVARKENEDGTVSIMHR
jgi:hypothetical protein